MRSSRGLAAFFPTGRRVTELAVDARPLEPWIDRLPQAHRDAARAFDVEALPEPREPAAARAEAAAGKRILSRSWPSCSRRWA